MAVTNSYTVSDLHTKPLYSTKFTAAGSAKSFHISFAFMDESFPGVSSSSDCVVSTASTPQTTFERCSLASSSGPSVATSCALHASGIISCQSVKPTIKS